LLPFGESKNLKVIRGPLLFTYIFAGFWTIDFEGHKIFWMFSNQVMALYRASLVRLFVGILLLNLMAVTQEVQDLSWQGVQDLSWHSRSPTMAMNFSP